MEEGSCVPSNLLHHVYTFLVQNNFRKAAKALQKSSDMPLAVQSASEATLLQFYAAYQKSHAGNRTAVTAGEGDAPPPKRRKRDRACLEEADGMIDPSDLKQGGSKKRKLKGRKSDAKDTSQDLQLTVNGHGTNACETTNGNPSSSSDEEVKPSPVTPSSAVAQQPSSAVAQQPSSSSSSEEEGGRDNNVETTPTPILVSASSARGSASSGKKKKLSNSGSKVPFRRVSGVVEVDPRLADNSFEAKVKSRGSWGEKANKDLKFTKGKSFRHEKTKKKRGTYKGGAIDTSVCSFKFDSASD